MAGLTYKELRREVRALAKEIRDATNAHHTTARRQNAEARDTRHVADQITMLRVDQATVAETREVARIMTGLSDAALAYATACEETARAATAAEEQAVTDHGGIQDAVDRSPVPMANAAWYRQE
jgi:hypothetical protein